MNRILLSLSLIALLAVPALAGDASKSFDFALDEWHQLDESDGPVTLHRFRIDKKEGRWTKSTLARPHNQEHLATVMLQLEYTNESSKNWKARINVTWLDENGKVIDGFTANETLDKRSARDVVQFSLSTLVYGLDRAESIEIQVHYVP